MAELGIAVGLVLVLEGALYTLFPDAMQRMMHRALDLPPAHLRRVGLFAAIGGFLVVWAIKG